MHNFRNGWKGFYYVMKILKANFIAQKKYEIHNTSAQHAAPVSVLGIRCTGFNYGSKEIWILYMSYT